MTVYTLSVAVTDPLTHPLRARKEMALINRLPGLLGAYPGWPAAIFAFATVPHAERAREMLRKAGTSCGKYIMEGELDEGGQHLQIGGPVCGWDNVEPGDLVKDTEKGRGIVEFFMPGN